MKLATYVRTYVRMYVRYLWRSRLAATHVPTYLLG